MEFNMLGVVLSYKLRMAREQKTTCTSFDAELLSGKCV